MLNNEKNTIININDISMDSGFYTVSMTDEFKMGIWPMSGDDKNNIERKNDKILEIRIFNEEVEYKWFRGNIQENFKFRKLSDNENEKYNNFEEYQILDIDLSSLVKERYELAGEVYTSKGGKFFLPIVIEDDKIPCLKVKYYVPLYEPNDENTIHSYVKDWRLAGLTNRTV